MELLRIIAMFSIVLFHVCLYVLVRYETQFPIIKPLYTLSHTGVLIFVLISGYFGIKPSVKGLAGLYFFMVFYNVLLYAGALAIGGQDFAALDAVKLFLPFTHSAPHLWFMKTYVLLYLVSPLLNLARDFRQPQQTASDEGGVKCKIQVPGGNVLILTCLGFILFWFGWINCDSELYEGRNLVEFSFLYLLGSFFRDRVVVTDENRMLLRRIFLWSFVGLNVLVGTALYFADGSVLDILRRICHPYSSPVLIAMASLLFLTFTTISFQSKAVNWAAGSMLAVYLIHENKYFDFIPWYRFVENHFLQDGAATFVLILLVAILALMLAAILIDQSRLALKRLFRL